MAGYWLAPPFRRARKHSIDCDPTPVRASVRGRRSGRQLDAGSVRFPRAYLRYVLGAEAPATRHGTASSETASWWGPRWPVFRSASSLFSVAAARLALSQPGSLEFGVVDPHAMQNYTHPAGQSDRRPLRPTPTNDPLRPCAQPSLLL